MKRIKLKAVKGLEVHTYPGEFSKFDKVSQVKSFVLELEKKYNKEYQALNFVSKEFYCLYRDMYFNLSKYECLEVGKLLIAFDESLLNVLRVPENYFIGHHLNSAKTTLLSAVMIIENCIRKIPIASLKYRIEYLKDQFESVEVINKKKNLNSLRRVS